MHVSICVREEDTHTLIFFWKKKKGKEISSQEGIKPAFPFLLWMYNQLTNEESGLSSGWMNLQAMAVARVQLRAKV